MRIGAGRFKGRRLPPVHGARPAGARLRTSLFSVLAGDLEGARVLDLFAGTGALGLEALSRGAGHVLLVDRDGRTCRALGAWLEAVGAGQDARVLRRDVLRRGPPAGPFDVVFLDPPFGIWEGPQGAQVYAQALEVLEPGGLLVVKLPARRDLPEDSRARLRLRRAASSAAYALIERVAAGEGA